MILLEMVLKVVIGVMVMEVDKMADEVTTWWPNLQLIQLLPPSDQISN